MENKAKYISGTILGRISVATIWGLGYFFGFSLVAILSFGLCHAEEFTVLTRGRTNGHRFPFFKQHGKFFLEAQCVSVVGWLFVGALMCLVTL